MTAQTYLGDCLEITQQLSAASVDLIYLDPPFFTQSVQKLGTRDREREFSFDDRWNSMKEYAEYLFVRLQEFRRVLAATGSIFFHCDQNASHLARFLLDEVFGREMFRAEIIWHYRRWSNSQRNLLPTHQTIYYYSKTSNYKFNELMQEYSPSTNVDQILQKRARDEFNKSVYARDDRGAVITNGYKKGVPLNDVWDIPFLNPKAKERTGYPTQKPILLLERIIHLATDEKDLVLDPFCGSGTTLVAAALCGRSSMGIDISPAAIEIAQMRLKNPAKTDSHLLKAGRDAYRTADQEALSHLKDLAIVPVQRNNGIDALLQEEINGGPVPIRVQRAGETLLEAAYALHKAAKTKNASIMLLVATDIGLGFDLSYALPVEVVVVDSTANAITRCINDLKANRADGKQRTLQIAAIKSKGITL
jgi:site-specific DNA-methyltransferase (adenine-specific)